MNVMHQIKLQLNAKRGQILLPSVLLVPLFILVIYLLFDLTNLSMTKVQHQFALDNAAYSQISSVSSYLNSMALLNGPSLYRVMLERRTPKINKISEDSQYKDPENVFSLFYKAGLFPSVGKDHETGINGSPAPASTDWDVAYYPEKLPEDKKYNDYKIIDDPGHSAWMVPHPPKIKPDEIVVMMNKDLVKNANRGWGTLANDIADYLKWNFFIGNIYTNLTYAYKQTVLNADMFRKGYFVNVGNCDLKECGKQGAKMIMPYLKIETDRFGTDKMLAYFTHFEKESPGDGVYEPFPMAIDQKMLGTTEGMFLFSHLTPKSMNLLQRLDRGVGLKQAYKTPANHFNKNLDVKYKPLVHTTVYMQCPRKGNNCVWPNPLPKYSVFLRP